MNALKTTKLTGLIKLLFISGIILALLLGAARTLFAPKDVNIYENRPANKVAALSGDSFSNSTFQSSMENALSDQIPLSQRAKKLYNDLNSEYQRLFLEPLIDRVSDRYIHCGDFAFYNGYMCYPMLDINDYAEAMEDTVSSYNAAIAAHPQIDFYTYLVEYEALLDFETGEKQPLFEYLQANLDLPEGHLDRFELDNFSDFAGGFYRLDHHWNAQGSYAGYQEIADMLDVSQPPLQPTDEKSFIFEGGSKSMQSGMTKLTEPVTAYRFEYPDFGFAYGAENKYFSGALSSFNYPSFYGGDGGLLDFDTGRPELENILIIGDSYDNAVLKLIASHFNHSYSVDLRYYQGETGSEFDLDSFTESHDISKVLFVGSFLLFAGDFILEN